MFSIQLPLVSLAPRLSESQKTSQSVTQFFGTSAGITVAYGNGLWVAGGNSLNGSMAYSTDGIEWLAGTNFFSVCSSVAFDPDHKMWVAVGYGGFGSIAYSMDGKGWSAATTNFFEGGEGLGVAYGNGRWVAVGRGVNGTIAYSTNGLVWQASSTNFFGSGQGNGVAYSPDQNRWIAVGGGENGNICYSDDGGQTFILSEPFFATGSGYGVAYGGGRWIAVGNDSLGNRSIAFSLNAVNWTPVDNFFLGGIGKSIAYGGNGLWVAVGFGVRGTIGYSTDNGNTWQSANSLFDGGPGGWHVAFNPTNGTWVAVGGESFQNVTIGYSSNGKLFQTKMVENFTGVPPYYLSLTPFFRQV